MPKISLDSMRELLHFGIPLLPHSLSFWLKSGMDKVLLTTYCGLTINGLYSMAMSFGAAYSIFFTAFKGAYVPYLQKRLNAMNDINRDSEKRSIVILSYRIMVCFSILSILAILVCWLAMKFLLSDKYLPSFQFVPWIILSQTIFSIYGLVVEFPYTVKKTFGLGIITFLGSLVQFLLSYTLISNYGSNGIKISLIIGNTIIAIAVWWYSNKVFPMPWFLKNSSNESYYKSFLIVIHNLLWINLLFWRLILFRRISFFMYSKLVFVVSSVWGQSKNHYNEAFIYNIRLMLFIVFWFLACSYVFHSSPTDNALFSIIFFAFGSAFFNSVIGWNVFRNRLLHCANVILGISLVVHFLHSFGIIGASPYYFRTGEDYVMSLLIFHTEWGEISTPIGSIYRFSSVFWEAGQAQIVVFFILMLFTDDLKNHLFNLKYILKNMEF